MCWIPKYHSADGYTALLDRVRNVLKKSYTEATDISRNGQAVTIKFSEFSVDIVPGFKRQGGGYLIPDSRGKRLDPHRPEEARGHLEHSKRRPQLRPGAADQDDQGLEQAARAPFRSFHLETLILKIFSGVTISDFPSGARYFFDKARTAVGYVVDDLAGYGDNIGKYLLQADKLADVKGRLERAYTRAVEAEQFAARGNVSGAYEKWRMIFDTYFPAYG